MFVNFDLVLQEYSLELSYPLGEARFSPWMILHVRPEFLSAGYTLAPPSAQPDGKPMPKLNVNDATREQLVETAGLRPAVADALLEFRAKHGGKIAGPETLGELPGVGPATLDQLRDVLDFRDKGERSGNGSDKGGNGAAEREVRQTTERTAEAAASVARSGAKVAREATETAARSGLQLVERTA